MENEGVVKKKTQ